MNWVCTESAPLFLKSFMIYPSVSQTVGRKPKVGHDALSSGLLYFFWKYIFSSFIRKFQKSMLQASEQQHLFANF